MFKELLSHIHPIMVHFPIALIIIATCYDLFLMVTKRKFSAKQGFWLWTVAFISAWIAIGTGPEEIRMYLDTMKAWRILPPY